MNLKPIKNLQDYEEAQKYMSSVFHKELTEDESNKVEIISILMEDFERKGNIERENLNIEPQIDYVFDLVTNASKYEKNSLVDKGLKLGEEFGELCAEILKLKGYKVSSESENVIKDNILLESTDCLIMIFDIMTNMGFTKEQICDIAEKQVNKWLNNIQIR